MAIAGSFDLEFCQLDAVTAFLNRKIHPHKPVYVELPDGARIPGMVAQLNRALYGLKDSPLLWYKEFSSTLEELGLQKSREEPCLFTNDWLMVIFYVDDVLLLYRREDKEKALEFKKKLVEKYEIRDEGEVKWFLGIRVIRDRQQRKI